VARRLARNGENVAVLHGNRSQNQRDLALSRFKQGQARVLVATDVASRGLDIIGIGLVINYDTPRDPDDYVHRVGRTARAKRQGSAISLLIEDEVKYIRKIEQLLKQPIARRQQQLAAAEINGTADRSQSFRSHSDNQDARTQNANRAKGQAASPRTSQPTAARTGKRRQNNGRDAATGVSRPAGARNRRRRASASRSSTGRTR